MTELKTAIEKSHNSAVGPDEVHYSFLKQIPQKSKELLFKIYNNIWTGKRFPKSWKQATIIPIPKSGKNTSYPKNYQPIALTSLKEEGVGGQYASSATKRTHGINFFSFLNNLLQQSCIQAQLMQCVAETQMLILFP